MKQKEFKKAMEEWQAERQEERETFAVVFFVSIVVCAIVIGFAALISHLLIPNYLRFLGLGLEAFICATFATKFIWWMLEEKEKVK